MGNRVICAIKVHVADPGAGRFTFPEQRTMYGGKHIAAGDRIFVFDSETSGGTGLIARGIVTSSETVSKVPGLARQVPRVTVAIDAIDRARQNLGRDELKTYSNWDDGRPETELNFKFYRQATDKIVGISKETATFLDGYF